MKPTTSALLACVALAFASCGSSDATSEAGTDTTAPVETTLVESSDTTEAATEPEADAAAGAPARIVSLSSTATEILFAIGAGDQVVAVDSFSNFPAEAPITDLSAFEPNLEAIAAYEPDLVVYAFDPDGDELATAFDGIGAEAIFQGPAATLDDVYAQIADLGIATGNEDGAAALNAELQSGIDAIVASLPADGEPLRLYHELDENFYSASSNSFIGQLYSLLGVANIADEADVDGFGYPQLNAEYILQSDPEIIVITTEVAYGADDVAARPGWDAMSAVRNGNVVVVDGDISSRWGPRLPEFLQTMADVIAGASVGS